MKKIYIVGLFLSVAGVAAYFFKPGGNFTCVCVTLLLSITMMYYAIRNILAISYRKMLYDLPDERRIHTSPTPRLGGVAFTPVICSSVILTLALHLAMVPEYPPSYPCYPMWICALIFIHMIGVVDDLIGVRYYVKLSTQIIAGVLVVFSGLWVDNLFGFFAIHSIPPAAGMPLTVFFIVALINAMNMIDGIDGLASGLFIISMSIFGIRNYLVGNYYFSIVAFAVLGTLLSFFYANVRGLGSGRHKLFMGDTGAQTIALIVSVMVVEQIMNPGHVPVKINFILALSPLLVPVFDIIHVLVFRIVRGKPLFRPDKTHIHHRLVRKGFSHAATLILILSFAVVLITMNVLLAPYMNPTLIFTVDAALWCLFNSDILRPRRHPESGSESGSNS